MKKYTKKEDNRESNLRGEHRRPHNTCCAVGLESHDPGWGKSEGSKEEVLQGRETDRISGVCGHDERFTQAAELGGASGINAQKTKLV